MRPAVEELKMSSATKTKHSSNKPPQSPKVRRGGRRDPAAIKMNVTTTKIEKPNLAIHHGSIFRWRPSQSLGFQVASVTATKHNKQHFSRRSSGSDTSITSSTSSISDTYSFSSWSTFQSEWTMSEQQSAALTSHGGAGSTLFVISKIDPWGPMAIFAPQLRVGMRIVAINHQPCPKTREGLQALLDSSHSPTDPTAPSPPAPPLLQTSMKNNKNKKKTPLHHHSDGKVDDEKSSSGSSTGWITIHAIDLEEELKQRQYYLQLNSERGMDPDEQRYTHDSTTNSSSLEDNDGERVLDDIREEPQKEDDKEEGKEVVEIIDVEIVTKELKPELVEDEKTDPELQQQLKALHYLEQKRQRAIAYEARQYKKYKSGRRRRRNERYMEKNIWNMKIRSEPATSTGMDDALDDFSMLPAAESRRQGPRHGKNQKEKRERMAETKTLQEIDEKVRGIEEGKKKARGAQGWKKQASRQTSATEKAKEEKEKRQKVADAITLKRIQKRVHQEEQNLSRDEEVQTASDWGAFPSWQSLLLGSSPPPPPPPESMTIGKSTASTITSKSNSRGGLQWLGYGWGLIPPEEDDSGIMIENAPRKLHPKAFISPQRWSCGPSVESEPETLSTKTTETPSIKNTKKQNSHKKRDPGGARGVAYEGVRDPIDCPGMQAKQDEPKQAQLQKIGTRNKGPSLSQPPGEYVHSMRSNDASEKNHRATESKQDVPKQDQLQKIGTRNMGPSLSSQPSGEYLHSIRSNDASGKNHHATVGQLRQLAAHLEMEKKLCPKQRHLPPPGKTSRVEKRPVPIPERARIRNSNLSKQVQRLPELRSSAEVALLRKEPKRKPTKTKAAATGNTTTAFTLPISRSKSSDEKKKMQLKRLQAKWKAARMRNDKEAETAALEEAAEAGVGEFQEWSISSLFLSLFTCGAVDDAIEQESDLVA